MGVLEEMLVRNGMIYHNSDGTTSTIGECAVACGLTVTDASGRVTHRIENGTWPGELVMRNLQTGLVEDRFKAA